MILFDETHVARLEGDLVIGNVVSATNLELEMLRVPVHFFFSSNAVSAERVDRRAISTSDIDDRQSSLVRGSAGDTDAAQARDGGPGGWTAGAVEMVISDANLANALLAATNGAPVVAAGNDSHALRVGRTRSNVVDGGRQRAPARQAGRLDAAPGLRR